MIHKIVVATLQVIPCEDTKSKTYTSSNNTIKQLPSLMTFLTKLVKYTNVYTGTLMATLIYLQKLKSRLPKNAHGLPCTRHRILLSCLILSSKFHNDSSPKNKHWAKYTDGLFNVKDINLMERQLIFLLNWDLKVTNEEMCQSLQSFWNQLKLILLNKKNFKNIFNKKIKKQNKWPMLPLLYPFLLQLLLSLYQDQVQVPVQVHLFLQQAVVLDVLQDLHQFPQIIYHQCIIATLTIIIIVKIHQVLFLLLVQIILQVVFIQ